MLPWKSFENLHTVMAILALFEKFSGKVCLYFCTLTLSASPNMMNFCTHSFDYACLRRLRLIVMKRFEIMEKIYLSKALLKMAGEGMHPPHPPSLESTTSNPNCLGEKLGDVSVWAQHLLTDSTTLNSHLIMA